MSELDDPSPASALWSADGAVADVVAMLLSLPNHGERRAPSLARTGTHLLLPL